MHPKYPHIFSPIRLGPIEIPNRFYASPHICPLTTSSGGPSEDFIAYYLARVKGGCGLVILSLAAAERTRYVQPSPYLRESIPEFRALADAVHRAGGKIFGQIWYWWGATGHWSPLSTPAPALAPSVVQYGLFERRDATREMTKREISGMLGTFRQSAQNLREAGFDGIMLHASHAAILEQFLSPYFNRRTDEYGGSLDNRMRFLIESLEAVREVARGEMAVGVRLNCDELVSEGYDTKDAYQILRGVCERGLIDYVDLDVAIEPDQFWLGMPPAFVEPHVYTPYVKAVRGAAGNVPVLSVLGRLTSVADGEQAIASGICDMVGAARALIAEPDLVKNAFEGHEDRSRTCIACNWCQFALAEGSQSCAINPASYRERAWGVESVGPAARRSKVLVIGGGPGGLEAARVSAIKGHEVSLFEARDTLGGALMLWSQLPGREFYRKSVDWWEREIRRLGVRIALRKQATADSILAERPDAVIVATGARYSKSGRSSHRDVDVPGYEQDFVYRPEEILSASTLPRGRVIVLDAEGLHTGVGVAEVLARAGAEVQYLTPHFAPVSPRIIATQEARFIMKRLRAAGVNISTTTYIRRIGNHEVIVYDVYSEEERTIAEVDAVILSTGRESVNVLEKELEGRVSQLFTIGDALAARVWAAASYEGQRFARYVGERGAPGTVSDAYFGSGDVGP
jgi:2,4-dienoyl-CoA reductase-like NADH-dependent reductase (Old Yellow Enzyme family)/thioredoxin reductase